MIEEGEARYTLEAVDAEAPEKLFHRRWAQTVIDSVQGSLCEEYQARGNQAQFDALQPYLFGNSCETRYESPADELGISVEAVRTAVKRLRQRFREAMREQIRFTVDEAEDVDEEIRALFAAFRKDGG